VPFMGAPDSCRTLLAGLAALHALGACGGEVGRADTRPSGGSAGLPASSGGTGGTDGIPLGGASSGGEATDGSATGGSECDAKQDLYYAAVEAAVRCDPAAAEPCTAYDGVECPPVGVNPDSVAALSAELSEFKAAGCALPLHSCLIFIMTPGPYTCQPDQDGAYWCTPFCEQLVGGRATCVSEFTGCATLTLPEGFCSEPSTQCCSPY
jgi:hypothetical protein